MVETIGMVMMVAGGAMIFVGGVIAIALALTKPKWMGL